MNLRLLVLLLSLSVSGCGLFDDDDDAPANQDPVASAGADFTADENTLSTLDGSASTDSDGNIQSYSWTQTAGPTVNLSGANQASATFTAPDVSTNTTLTFQITVTDNLGASTSDTVDVTVNDVSNQNPTANAGADQTVAEGAAVTLDGSASTDSDGTIATYLWSQTAGPTATITNPDQAMATLMAPDVTVDTVLTFQVTVTDNMGATASDTVDITVTNVTNQNPTATAGVDQMVTEGATVTLDGSASSDPDGTIASYMWSQTVGPNVTIANPTQATATFTAPMVAANTTLTFQLVVTDNVGATGTDTIDVVVMDMPAAVTISGKATYDHVKHNTTTNALDYSLTTQDPVARATVQALDASGAIIASTISNGTGDYVLSVPQNTNVRIRVRAETINAGPPSWDIRLVDNTSSGAPYVLDGSLTTSGTIDSVRNLNAASGWDAAGMNYTSTRASAPFAIMASIDQAIQKTTDADAMAVFPPVLVNWSPNNVPSECPGGNAAGCISTSNYDGTAIYILGAANTDTDEFDGHIIVHEWGHYFEAKLSRSDSTGGPHGGTDILDTRIALGEGFGNALSGFITADPFYRDSSGPAQNAGFEVNLETNALTGWFNEDTVQSLFYDLFDTTQDGATDIVALDWSGLYRTFVNVGYTNGAARTNMHSYLHQLKLDNPAEAANIVALAATFNVNGNDAFGAGETHLPAGLINTNDILPVYTDIAPNGTAVLICSINEFGLQNKLSARRLMKLDIATDGMYRIIMAQTNTGDPDGLLYKARTKVTTLDAIGTSEDVTVALTAGTHVLEVFDACNMAPDASCPASGNTRSCFNISVTQL